MIHFIHSWRRASLAAIVGMIMVSTSDAATLSVTGRLEGSSNEPILRGDTMDYYKFEVTTSGSLTIEARRDGILVLLASYIGLDNEFASVGNPFRLDSSTPCATAGCLGDPTVSLQRSLPTGIYVIAITTGFPTSYDIFDGYKAVNSEGGGFASFGYQVAISGNVRGLEYWDGHLDGTFTVTSIPEPGTASLLGGSALLLCHRNAHTRKQNKALLPTPRGWQVFIAWCRSRVQCVWRVFSRP